jgi:four-jointed box protein 1
MNAIKVYFVVDVLNNIFHLFDQDGADKEKRPAIMRETIHNLGLSTTTGSLWLIDNESAFLDAYSLLFGDDENGNRFIQFHEVMLRTMCIFRKRTVNRLFALHKSIEPANLLLKFISDNEPLFSELPKIYPNSVFVEHFPERLEQVWQWIKQCQLHVQY